MKTIKDYDIIAVPFEEKPIDEDGNIHYASIHHILLDGRLPMIGQFNPQGWCYLGDIPATKLPEIIKGNNHYWLKLVPKISNTGIKNFPTEAHKMREVGEILKQQLPKLGWALLVFEFGNSGLANYISNAQRNDMIKALEETLERFKKYQDFKTPESN